MAAVGDGAPRRDVDSTDRHRENEDGLNTLEDRHPPVAADLGKIILIYFIRKNLINLNFAQL